MRKRRSGEAEMLEQDDLGGMVLPIKCPFLRNYASLSASPSEVGLILTGEFTLVNKNILPPNHHE
jgi:hypothetical protein